MTAMNASDIEACVRYIKDGEMLMGAPGEIEAKISGWCEALLGDLEAERAAHAKTTQALRDAVSARACWVPRALELLKERPPCS